MSSAEPSPDFILFSGDLAAHRLPYPDFILDTIRQATSLFDAYFKGQTVFPVIGNDDLPDDYYLPALNGTWLKLLSSSSLWGRWLPPSTLDTFQKGGYYTTTLPSNPKVGVLRGRNAMQCTLIFLGCTAPHPCAEHGPLFAEVSQHVAPVRREMERRRPNGTVRMDAGRPAEGT